MARCVATRFCLPPSQYGGENRGRVYLLWEEFLIILMETLRWLETVSSTFQDLQFDGSLEPLFIG